MVKARRWDTFRGGSHHLVSGYSSQNPALAPLSPVHLLNVFSEEFQWVVVQYVRSSTGYDHASNEGGFETAHENYSLVLLRHVYNCLPDHSLHTSRLFTCDAILQMQENYGDSRFITQD